VTSPREAAPQSGAPNNALDLDGLRKLAEAATPGPWQRSGVRQTLRDEDCVPIAAADDKAYIFLPIGRDHAGALRDASFIAAFNPQAALALLQRLTDAEVENASLRERLEAVQAIASGPFTSTADMMLGLRHALQRRDADAAASRPPEHTPQSTEST
jgi:Ead/Ea22-like protein